MRRFAPYVALLVALAIAAGCASTDLSRYSPTQARAHLETLQTLRFDTLTLAAQLYRDGLIDAAAYHSVDQIDTQFRLAWWQASRAVDALDMAGFARHATAAQAELKRLTEVTK